MVTTSADSGGGSLREIIAAAAAGDIITFAPGLTTVALERVLKVFTDNLTIDGGSAGVTITVTGKGYRHMDVLGLSARLTIKNIVFDGAVPGRQAGEDSGGVQCDGSLVLEGVTIRNCAANSGGGVYALTSATLTDCLIDSNIAAANSGGGVNAPAATLTSCRFFSNIARYNGGGVYADTAKLDNCTFSGNSSDNGGGVWASTAKLSCCTVTGNTSAESGGGVYVTGTLSLSGSIVSGNTTNGIPSEVQISGSVTVNGDGTLVEDGSYGSYYILGVPEDGLPAVLEADGGRTKPQENADSLKEQEVPPEVTEAPEAPEVTEAPEAPEAQASKTGDTGALPCILALLICGVTAGVLVFTKKRRQK